MNRKRRDKIYMLMLKLKIDYCIQVESVSGGLKSRFSWNFARFRISTVTVATIILNVCMPAVGRMYLLCSCTGRAGFGIYPMMLDLTARVSID
jgi:hypothetical protein